MTTLPPFQIDGVEALWSTTDDSNNITDLTREAYDAFIKSHPEARLKYLDEDEEEVIVGSSTELFDRINEAREGEDVVFQTVDSVGRDVWIAFMLDRSTPDSERVQVPEDVERTLFEGFQRDLERAIKESLEASSTSDSPSSTTPRPKPSVESFLQTLTETVQSTLNKVYPHAASVTQKLRENPALRQAAEVLQSVGYTANQALHHPEERKKMALEVKTAVQNVGNVLGEVVAEIGGAYAQASREFRKDVREIGKEVGEIIGKARAMAEPDTQTSENSNATLESQTTTSPPQTSTNDVTPTETKEDSSEPKTDTPVEASKNPSSQTPEPSINPSPPKAPLRQATALLQSVGRSVSHTANQALHNPEERKKMAENVRDEVKGAVWNVGSVLGDVVAEIGGAYALVGREIGKEVKKVGKEVGGIIERTRGAVGANLSEERSTTEVQAQGEAVPESTGDGSASAETNEKSVGGKPDSSAALEEEKKTDISAGTDEKSSEPKSDAPVGTDEKPSEPKSDAPVGTDEKSSEPKTDAPVEMTETKTESTTAPSTESTHSTS